MGGSSDGVVLDLCERARESYPAVHETGGTYMDVPLNASQV